MNNLRRVQKLCQGIFWEDINFKELKPGDIFKMFEPDGTPVVDNNNEIEFVADSEPYLNENNLWTIRTTN